jgi:hypothetical protein
VQTQNYQPQLCGRRWLVTLDGLARLQGVKTS